MSQTPDRLTAAFDQVKKDVKMFTSLKTYEKMSQNQIIGGLTVLLLVVGVAAGVYLGQTNQETRQQAYAGKPCTINANCDAGETCVQNQCMPQAGCLPPAFCIGTGSDCIAAGGLPNSNLFCAAGICCTGTGTASPTPLPNNCPSGQSCVASDSFCQQNGGGATNLSCTRSGGLAGRCCDFHCGSSSPADCVNGIPSVTSCSLGGSFGNTGICQLTGSGSTCSCVGPTPTSIPVCMCGGSSDTQCIGKSVNSSCTSGGQNFVCGAGSSGLTDSQGNYFCTCSSIPSPFCGGNGGGGTSSPTPTPTQVPGACSSTTVTPDNTCGGGTCGACQRRTGINVSTTTGANCSDVCVADNSCCPGATNTPVPTNPPQATNTPVPNTPGQPTNTPVPNATNTPVIAPVCLNVTLNNPASTTPNTPPNIGDAVTLTCSQVSGASRYEFRVKLPNNTYLNVNPSLTTLFVSQQFQITLAGSYNAACRACATVDEASCSPWEN